nr:tRNA dihydrouridine(20/20a) synthase DusA [uncultured Shimia sp.]
MMDWTDRHCRYFHRLMSGQALLYTEMVTSPALVRGNAVHLLAYNPEEHPVALQLGGSDPVELAKAAKLGDAAGYDEINLNVGCPSDRVQSGTFGAVLMKNPDLVSECVKAMQDAVSAEVTVKCRIGVDEQDPDVILPEFLEKISAAGITRVTIHARKAWLKGLSPKENRDIPPLDYPLVFKMKETFPHLHMSLNGGVQTQDDIADLLATGMDGVMVGRAAYHAPASILVGADSRFFNTPDALDAQGAVRAMLPYMEDHLSKGGRLNQITRHMLGVFTSKPGARGWRRALSEGVSVKGAGPELVERALDEFVAAQTPPAS